MSGHGVRGEGEQLDKVLGLRVSDDARRADEWRREAERLKVENDKLQSERLSARQASESDPEIMALARIVAELQRLDDAERGRTLRYLNHRYADSGAPVVRRGGLVINPPGGAPPL